ncbi:MAG: hypothetical protein FWH27_04830 [Planctomycetaceae bacterium]|nr:hypothetical protein [Planctomycetaceae bacterium]
MDLLLGSFFLCSTLSGSYHFWGIITQGGGNVGTPAKYFCRLALGCYVLPLQGKVFDANLCVKNLRVPRASW